MRSSTLICGRSITSRPSPHPTPGQGYTPCARLQLRGVRCIACTELPGPNQSCSVRTARLADWLIGNVRALQCIFGHMPQKAAGVSAVPRCIGSGPTAITLFLRSGWSTNSQPTVHPNIHACCIVRLSECMSRHNDRFKSTCCSHTQVSSPKRANI
jgi:hypothetical protein